MSYSAFLILNVDASNKNCSHDSKSTTGKKPCKPDNGPNGKSTWSSHPLITVRRFFLGRQMLDTFDSAGENCHIVCRLENTSQPKTI